jgi:general secretion pathway protein A
MGIIKTHFLNEHETRLFIGHRLKNADAPLDLLDEDTIEIIAAFTKGNRRTLMNTATMVLEEVYGNEEKIITADTLYNSAWFNDSE